MFNIIDTSTGQKLENASGALLVFANSKEANAHIAGLVAQTGNAYQLRPAAKTDSADWRARERKRFETGEYKRVSVLEDRNLIKEDHFVHMSQKDPISIAYTKNESKGIENIQTSASITGYLETYFSDVVNQKQRKEISEEHEKLHYKNEVKFALTPDEIERVYTKYSSDANAVADSCMRYTASNFYNNGKIHPTRVYGAGDLAIAYLTDQKGLTIARALCWPDKKVYSRVYGGTALHSALKALGYEKSGYYGESKNPDGFVGARLLKIEVSGSFDTIVMPYIDEGSLNVSDGGKFLTLSKDRSCAEGRSTNGVARLFKLILCKKCQLKSKQEDFSSVVVGKHTNSNVTESWCKACYTKKGFYCSGYNLVFDADVFKSISVELYSAFSNYRHQYKFSKDYIDKNLNTYAYCEHNQTRACSKDRMVSVIVDTGGKVEMWSPESVRKDAWKCDKTGVTISKIVKPIKVVSSIKENRRTFSTWCANAVKDHADVMRDKHGRKLFIDKTVCISQPEKLAA